MKWHEDQCQVHTYTCTWHRKEVGSMKPINPVAKAMLMLRKPKQVVKPKKGKGSYDRAKEKRNALRSKEL